MAKRLRGITFDEHEALGKELYAFHQRMFPLAQQLRGAYGVGSKPVRYMEQMAAAVEKLRCELDDKVCEENPNRPDRDVIQVYYRAQRRDE